VVELEFDRLGLSLECLGGGQVIKVSSTLRTMIKAGLTGLAAGHPVVVNLASFAGLNIPINQPPN
jgi:hypothetical protein